MTEQETWEKSPDDVIMAGSNQVMSHQERVEILSFLSKLSEAKPIKREDIGIWLRSLLD
jgi:hypothetical protein